MDARRLNNLRKTKKLDSNNISEREKLLILKRILDDGTFESMTPRQKLDYFESNKANLLLMDLKQRGHNK